MTAIAVSTPRVPLRPLVAVGVSLALAFMVAGSCSDNRPTGGGGGGHSVFSDDKLIEQHRGNPGGLERDLRRGR